MISYGYGKILDVDLSTGQIVKKDVEPQFAREYIGGMGFSGKILYDEVGADVDPFSPKNVVIFANGPLTGIPVSWAGRTEITTKSALTGSIGTGNTGGVWGARLKHAGFDLIVVRNQAEKPAYLWIDDDVVEIRDASHLWGQDVYATSDIIEREAAPRKVSVLAIGPAGENLVRYACPVNDYYHVAARCGAGAVMGAKRLKAIAVRGTGAVKLARPKEFQEAVREVRQRLMMSGDALRSVFGAGGDVIKRHLEQGSLPAKNYQTGVLPQWLETRGRDVVQKYFTVTKQNCYACPNIQCLLTEVKEGKYAGTKVRGVNPGVVFEWGAKCAIDNLPAIAKIKELSHHFGMDYVSAAGVIAFAIELFQRGLITKMDTDGLELSWGNEDAAIQMLHKIAFRDGFGDVLAEGSLQAARTIGKGAEQYVMTIKGMEMGLTGDPRAGTKGWVFEDLTNPRGGDNVKGTHMYADLYNPNWWVDKFDMFEDVKQKIYTMPPQEVSSTWEGKALMCKWFEDLYSALNALGLSFFPAGMSLAVGPTHLSKLFAACTGWDTTPQDIMNFGEKIFTLLKAYNVRHGLTRKDDTWPDRFYTEPLPEGPAKGAVFSRETINRVLDEYYELRGWDKESSFPTKEKLVELGLVDIANDLLKRGNP